MKKNLPLIFLCLMLFATLGIHAQALKFTPNNRAVPVAAHNANGSITPGGYFDVMFDRFGKQYSLNEIAVNDKIRVSAARNADHTSHTAAAPTALYTGCTPGYFRIYLEDSCGMDHYATDPAEAANLAVLCQVLTDISNFIPSPCTSSGQTVNIWVRGGLTSGLGAATPFFNIPYSLTKTGIADNTVWQTLNSGVDAFKNIAPPLVTSGGGTTGSTSGANIYFHGSLALNFDGSIAWHNDMHTTPAAGESDLYTVILHEMMHLMGFCTLIDYNGRSVFDVNNTPPTPPTFTCFSRYDMHLQTGASARLIIDSSVGCDLYQYGFNPAAAAVPNSILSPGGTSASGCSPGFYTGSGETDSTVCATAIQYLGGWGTPIPVYTPQCFEKGGSLSHFDDQCHVPSGFCPACVTTNCEYFVMSNSAPNPALGGYSATTNPGVMKRYLTPEERSVLCDIGYPVLTAFGSATNLNNYSYGGAACPGAQVVGFNDGITDTGTYAFSTTSGVGLLISGPSIGSNILENDRSAGISMGVPGTYFKCLQVMTGTGTVSIDSGGIGDDITYIPGATDFGVQLLRYIPVNASGVEGGITYIYVFVGDASCVPSACNLVTNGDFENVDPGSYGELIPGLHCWTTVNGTPTLLSTEAAGLNPFWQIPNYAEFINGIPHPLSSPGNNHYAALWSGHNAGGWFSSSMQEQLSVPLDSGQQYTITFWALLGGPSGAALTNPAYVSLLGTTSPGIGIDTCGCCNSNITSHIQFAVGATYPLIGLAFSAIPAPYMPPGFTPLETFSIVSNNYLWQSYSVTITYTGPSGASTLLIQSTFWDDVDSAINDSSKFIAIDDISIVPAANACPFTVPGLFTSLTVPFSLSGTASVCVSGGTFSWPTMPIVTGSGIPKPTMTTSDMFDPYAAYTASIGTGGNSVIPIAYTFTTPAGCQQTVYTNVQIDSAGTPLGVTNPFIPARHIYPNPAENILHVDCLANCTYRLLSIVDLSMQQGPLNNGQNNIPLQALPPGIYLLEITDIYGQKTVTKIIKQ